MNLIERLEYRRERSEEERLVLDQVARLADESIAPRAARYDRTAEFPADNMAAINELGLNAIFVPDAYGGALLPFGTYLECVKLLTRACASTGIIYATTFHAMKPLIDFGSPEQKARLLPRIARGGLGSLVITEPTAGSDATAMRTRFVPDGDGSSSPERRRSSRAATSPSSSSSSASGRRSTTRGARSPPSSSSAGRPVSPSPAARTRWGCGPRPP